MSLFKKLKIIIDDFIPEEPIFTENVLEEILLKYLKNKGFAVTRQVTKKRDRYDLIVKDGKETVCIELKKKASIKDIKQFDRYLPKFKDGLIIICWQCTSNLKEIFNNVKRQSPFQLALIELSKRYSF